jgi:hypothetical protein
VEEDRELNSKRMELRLAARLKSYSVVYLVIVTAEYLHNLFTQSLF